MPTSSHLAPLLELLTRRARVQGLTDSAWAARAGLRKETLSRLRGRSDCDFETLSALAQAVGARIGATDAFAAESTTPDGHFVRNVDRDYEERLVDLCASRNISVEQWQSHGPRFFMAGLAVMLANLPEFDRRALLDLAENLHPGASAPEVFARWLARSPLRPSRFLPLVSARVRHAA